MVDMSAGKPPAKKKNQMFVGGLKQGRKEEKNDFRAGSAANRSRRRGKKRKTATQLHIERSETAEKKGPRRIAA